MGIASNVKRVPCTESADSFLFSGKRGYLRKLDWLRLSEQCRVDGTKHRVSFSRTCSFHFEDAGNRRRIPTSRAGKRSGKAFNTIHANDFSFFEEINRVVQEEPNEAMDPETLGLLAAIGIEKGKQFAPDARMKKILTEAVAVGNATARAIVFKARMKDAFFYPNNAWCTPFIGGSYEFLAQPGVRNLEARTMMFYYATGITPAMAVKMVGAGSQYAVAFVDSNGNPLNGSKTYKIHLPPNIPVKTFWSFVVYDNQTRSMLQTDARFPSISSQKEDIVINPDTSVDVWFAPAAPAGHEANWAQTVPGKGWNTILRLSSDTNPIKIMRSANWRGPNSRSGLGATRANSNWKNL